MILADKWVLLGFGWGVDDGYIKSAHDTGGVNFNNLAHTVSSWGALGDIFVGDKEVAMVFNENFTIHSIAVYSDQNPGMNVDFQFAPSNGYFYDNL